MKIFTKTRQYAQINKYMMNKQLHKITQIQDYKIKTLVKYSTLCMLHKY